MKSVYLRYFFLGIGVTLFFTACNPEFNTVGIDLIATDQFETTTQTYPVYFSQEKVEDVVATGLPVMQLGKLERPNFGRLTASISTQLTLSGGSIFGLYTQEEEDNGNEDNVRVIAEDEQVTEVFLEIPFLTNQNDNDNDGVIDAFDVDDENIESDSDGDGIFDYLETRNSTNPLAADSDGDGILEPDDDDNSGYDPENNVYEIDSIFGNTSAQFDLKISELTYQLNGLDPNNNFETVTEYYSARDFHDEGFVGEVLYNAPYTFNFEELRFNYEEDDIDTPDVDETTLVETRKSPRLRVPLDPSFFQERLIDLEGEDEISNNENFRQQIKGLNIRLENLSEDLFLYLNMAQANIEINYTFNRYNDNGTPDDETDFSVDREARTYNLSVRGIQVNHFSTETSLQPQDSSKIYLSGNLGDKAILRLFDEEDQSVVVDDVRGSNWLINEANLIFYIDPDYVANWTPEDRIAERIYLYNHETNLPLSDYYTDDTTGSDPRETKIIHGGILEYQDGVPYRYKFRITDHVSGIIRRDSTSTAYENVPIGMVVTYDINAISNKSGRVEGSTETIEYPLGALLNPLGTVLIGPQPAQDQLDKRLELEIIYTDFSN